MVGILKFRCGFFNALVINVYKVNLRDKKSSVTQVFKLLPLRSGGHLLKTFCICCSPNSTNMKEKEPFEHQLKVNVCKPDQEYCIYVLF